jgi:outer membrane cobalamin receptor
VIERIEVLRAASAEFSTQSIAGTVNIVLKKAVKAAQRELKAGLRPRQRPSTARPLNLQLSDKLGKLSYSLRRECLPEPLPQRPRDARNLRQCRRRRDRPALAA